MELAVAGHRRQHLACRSSRSRRSSRVRTSCMRASCRTTTRRAWSSTTPSSSDRDKFSGYDRVEGGTRAQLRPSTTSARSARTWCSKACSASPTRSPARTPSPRRTSPTSAHSPASRPTSRTMSAACRWIRRSVRLAVRGRFDEEDSRRPSRRGRGHKTTGSLTASAAYGYIRDVPTAGIDQQSFVNAQASVQIADRWRVFGSAVYDFSQQAGQPGQRRLCL